MIFTPLSPSKKTLEIGKQWKSILDAVVHTEDASDGYII